MGDAVSLDTMHEHTHTHTLTHVRMYTANTEYLLCAGSGHKGGHGRTAFQTRLTGYPVCILFLVYTTLSSLKNFLLKHLRKVANRLHVVN